MIDTYKTIEQLSEGLYKEKGSKFYSYALPCDDESEAKQILESYRKKFHDARHICYAYRIGMGLNLVERANDDGEPNNSAGKPILNQIQTADLTNTLVLVVRYFGGTLLGVSGLITAYKLASKEALLSAKISNKRNNICFSIEFNYPNLNQVQKVLNDEKVIQIENKYSEKCQITIGVLPSKVNQLKKKLDRICSIKEVE